MRKKRDLEMAEYRIQRYKQELERLTEVKEVIDVYPNYEASVYVHNFAHKKEFIEKTPATIVLLKHGSTFETVYVPGIWDLDTVKTVFAKPEVIE